MKIQYLLSIMSFIFLTPKSFCQNNKPEPPVIITGGSEFIKEKSYTYIPCDTSIKEPPVIVSDKPALFPGGSTELLHFIHENFVYPKWDKKHRIEGTAYVKFVINKKGKVLCPQILRPIPGSKDIDDEIIRIINSMPLWIPGTNKNGENINIYFQLPVRLKLPKE